MKNFIKYFFFHPLFVYAWGNIISQTGTMASSNPYRYAGYRYDNETGLYYLMARYYDSNNGRFITRETFQGFEKDPLSLNQYAYTQNNPIMGIAPSGFATISIVIRASKMAPDFVNYGTAATVFAIAYLSVLQVGRYYGFSRYSDRGSLILTTVTMVLGRVAGGRLAVILKMSISIFGYPL